MQDGGLAVGAPALEARRVPEAVTLEVLVRDLGDPLDAERHPRHVLLGVPAVPGTRHPGLRLLAPPLPPGVAVERVLLERRELGGELRPQGCGEAARDTDVVQVAVVVVEPEEQRAHTLAVLVDPVSRDDAVGGAEVLHLLHRSLALEVGLVGALGHHTVEPCSFEAREPIARRPPGPWSAA